MRPFTSTMPFADALQIVLQAAAPIERTDTVVLADADGRVLADDLVAAMDVPPFDRAAMDGYAVVARDTDGAGRTTPIRLRCAGRTFTGDVTDAVLQPGTCVEIATGAPLPPGADAVVIVEDTSRRGDDVEVRSAVRPGQHIGRRGADMRAGDVVLGAGTLLTPGGVGAIAGLGLDRVRVYARPRVAILSTGNEIVSPGDDLAPGQIYDINSFTLAAVVRRHGGDPVLLTSVADTIEDLVAALDRAAAHDVVVCSGGSSVGDRDLLRDALAARAVVHFHGIAVKPGKPTAFATMAGTPVFAMPGYPTSCLSNAYILLVPFLRRVARLPAWHPRRLEMPLTRSIVSTPGRLQFYSVRLTDAGAEPAFKASGDITSLAHADGYIEIPADVERVEAGSVVTVTCF